MFDLMKVFKVPAMETKARAAVRKLRREGYFRWCDETYYVGIDSFGEYDPHLDPYTRKYIRVLDRWLMSIGVNEGEMILIKAEW